MFGIGLLQKLFESCKNICFEAIQNGSKSECSRLKQRSEIKFLVAEKCKPYKILEECVRCMEKKHVLIKKNVYKWVKHGFVTMSLS